MGEAEAGSCFRCFWPNTCARHHLDRKPCGRPSWVTVTPTPFLRSVFNDNGHAVGAISCVFVGIDLLARNTTLASPSATLACLVILSC